MDELGIDDLDDFEIQDEVVNQTEENNHETQDTEDSFISDLLKSRGIEDPTKIKFENEEGDIEEMNWNTLSNSDKLNILNSSTKDNNDDDSSLDSSEIELINAIRSSNLTPDEYIKSISNQNIQNYINQNQNSNYEIDQYDDDELYLMDLITRSDNITDEEALELLDKAKSNEELFNKQIRAIRNEYKQKEYDIIQNENLEQQRIAQEQYNQYAQNIGNSILNFKEFSGCELNMDEEDMQNLYEFIVGYDNAGNNWFSKALQNPDTIVQMAWFALNGEKMIQDINEYYKKEIANVRKESYNKGVNDTKNKDNKSTFIYKEKNSSNNQQDYDLDEF